MANDISATRGPLNPSMLRRAEPDEVKPAADEGGDKKRAVGNWSAEPKSTGAASWASKGAAARQRAQSTFNAAGAQPANVASVDPPFLPAGFDMNKAVEGLRQILTQQGVSPDMLQPGKVQNTAMTDFDGTLGASFNVPVFLRAKTDVMGPDGKELMKAGDYFKDDKGNDLMIRGMTGADVGGELNALKTKFPNLPWGSVTQDWHAFDDRALAMKTPLNKAVLKSLEEPTKNGPTGLVVITSRTTQDVAGGIRENLLQHTGNKFPMVGVVTTGAPEVQKALGVDSPTLTDGQRKAIVQMVAMTMLGGANLKSHRFYEDSVGNDAPALQSLSQKFPSVDTKVFLAQHHLNDTSTPALIGRSNGLGQFTDPRDGGVWTPDKITAFATSTPQPQFPPLQPARVEQH
jgi:hypothetical protein